MTVGPRFVIDGQTLYISPRAFMQMKNTLENVNGDPEVIAEFALRDIGVPQFEIEAAKGRGFTVVVDYKLEDKS